MRILKTLVLLLALATWLPKQVISQIPTQPNLVSTGCFHSTAGNFTLNSTYQNNLNLVFSELIGKASTYKFFNSSAGPSGNPNTTYGQYYCRGDISAQLCHGCIKAAVQVASDEGKCLAKSGIVEYAECLLWYDKKSNVGLWTGTWPPYGWWNIYNNVSDPTKFGQVFISLLNMLIKKAAYGGDPLEFATGEAYLNPLETVYCLVQCSPDIIGSNCESCLNEGKRFIATNFLGYGPDWLFVSFPNCQIRYSLSLFYSSPSATLSPPPSPPIDALPSSRSGKDAKHNVTTIVVPVVAGSILLLCCISFAIWFCFYRRKRKTQNSTQPQLKKTRDFIREDSKIGSIECFVFRAIEEATMKFSLVNKLGEGGYGSVYKGILAGGNLVAIKRLATKSGQGIREFKTEVAVVAKLQHRNLVRLVGFCVENEERILVYEYMANLSLDKFLFDATKSFKLDWRTRYKIIEGIATGLRYLHIDSLLTIVHRDLKSSNILLDDEMKPKIADFGLAKLVQIDETTGNTSRIGGTYGYMAPEYAMTGRFSIKSDIYSFGVIILEIISGKSISQFYDPVNGGGLLHHAWSIWNERAIEKLVDPTLQHNYSKDEAERCLQLALLCVQDESTTRPPIRVVIGMLENMSLELPSPASPSASFFCSPHTNNVSSETQVGHTQQYSQVGFHDSSSGMHFDDMRPR